MPDPLTQALLDKANLPQVNKLREVWDEPTYLQKLGNETETFPQDTNEGTKMALIPRPPQFQQNQPQAMSPEVDKILNSFMRIAPHLQPFLGKVQQGPTKLFGDRIDRSNALPNAKHRWTLDDLPQLNILGLTDLGKYPREIGLNPSLEQPTTWPADPYSLPSSLAHEVTHAMGYANETKPEESRDIVTLLLNKELAKRK